MTRLPVDQVRTAAAEVFSKVTSDPDARTVALLTLLAEISAGPFGRRVGTTRTGVPLLVVGGPGAPT